MTNFIGFAGKKQTGKSTSADILKVLLEQQGFKVAITAFAEPLKKMCIEILGLKPEGVYGTNEQKNASSHIEWGGMPEHIRTIYHHDNGISCHDLMTNREVLQKVGTEIFRALYNDVWALAPFNQDWSEYDYVIFADVRFENEIKAIEDRGGIVIRLERKTGLNDDHESETALDNYEFKHKFVNNGDLNSLEQYLRSVATYGK